VRMKAECARGVLWLVLLVLLTGGAQPRSPQAPRKEERTWVAGSYRLVLQTSRLQIPEGDLWGWWGGSRPVEKRIEQLRLYRSGKRLFVPRSAFLDLLDPKTVSIQLRGSGCEIIIDGSDAGESYTARIKVVGKNVKERSVRSREFPRLHWEKTLYRAN